MKVITIGKNIGIVTHDSITTIYTSYVNNLFVFSRSRFIVKRRSRESFPYRWHVTDGHYHCVHCAKIITVQHTKQYRQLEALLCQPTVL